MSYAIIRNTNYKMKNLAGIYRHNERKNTNYSNKNINKQNSILNYSIKTPYSTYEKVFKDIRKKYNLQGMIKKVSNVMCEFIITSDKEFFNSIGEEETKRYFETAYKFVSNYNNLGEDFIVSAKVHNDESTPHMHIVFIPFVHKKDKNGKEIKKIACSEYWKGKDSYRKLQDNFYSYMTKSGFNLERGNKEGNEHIPIEKLKKITSYETQEMFEESQRELEEHKAKIPELTKKWKEWGKENLSFFKRRKWNKCVPIRLDDLYQGWELDCFKEFFEAYKAGKSKEELKQVLQDQGHSGMSYGLMCSLICTFIDKDLAEYLHKI